MAKRKKLEEKVEVFVVDTDFKTLNPLHYLHCLLRQTKGYHCGLVEIGESHENLRKEAIDHARKAEFHPKYPKLYYQAGYPLIYKITVEEVTYKK